MRFFIHTHSLSKFFFVCFWEKRGVAVNNRKIVTAV